MMTFALSLLITGLLTLTDPVHNWLHWESPRQQCMGVWAGAVLVGVGLGLLF